MPKLLKRWFSAIPKPIFFALLGGTGCLLGALVAEPALSLISADPESADSDASPVLVFSPEFNRRLEREGAKSGDVQFSLMWSNVNDLDLHCVDPTGEKINYSNKKSASGGELDVDMNVSEPRSTEPVENIYWPAGEAPKGSYKVYVEHYRNHGGEDPSSFVVGIKANGETREIRGSICSGDAPFAVGDIVVEEIAVEPTQPQSGSSAYKTAGIVGLWTGLLAMGLAASLYAGQNFIVRKPLLSFSRSAPLLASALGAGTLAGLLGQLLFSSLSLGGSSASFGQAMGWAVLGATLGFGMSYVIPNLPRMKSALAGGVGGIIGAFAFFATVSTMPELVARLAGACFLGAAIGLMIAVAESLAREACLIVHWGPKEKSVINLGSQPVVLGSSPKAQLYLPRESGFPPEAALVTFANGKIQMQNKMTNSTHELQHGNKLKLGTLTVEVQAFPGK